MGQLSVQRAAASVLEKYYQDFPIYNPYLDRPPSKKKQAPNGSSFKYYDVDGNEENVEVSVCIIRKMMMMMMMENVL